MIREITDKILSLAKIECPSCGSSMSLNDYSRENEMFRCPHCNSVFAAGGTLHRNADISVSPRPEIAMPPKISISNSEGYYIITRKWFGPPVFFLAFFALFWNGFMVVWNTIAISTGEYIMLAFGLLHTAVGIFVAYLAIAGFINKTDVKLGRGKIIIKHRPLWWPGSKEFNVAQFSQLFSAEKVNRSKNGTTYTYELKGKTHDGSKIKLIGGLESADQALFLEQKIENFIGINDLPVSGEIPR